jgi:class 3 adenylate cyclase
MWGTKKNKKLTIKIGIHHGNVIIGVIGFHKPQFSLIGDAVNTTSRHCSTANPGEVVVSSVAFQLLKKFPASSFTKSTKKMKGLG